MTQVFFNNGLLSFDGSTLATVLQFNLGDRCVGSIFEALEQGEQVELKDGFYTLDAELDLVQCECDFSNVYGTEDGEGR